MPTWCERFAGNHHCTFVVKDGWVLDIARCGGIHSGSGSIDCHVVALDAVRADVSAQLGVDFTDQLDKAIDILDWELINVIANPLAPALNFIDSIMDDRATNGRDTFDGMRVQLGEDFSAAFVDSLKLLHVNTSMLSIAKVYLDHITLVRCGPMFHGFRQDERRALTGWYDWFEELFKRIRKPFMSEWFIKFAFELPHAHPEIAERSLKQRRAMGAPSLPLDGDTKEYDSSDDSDIEEQAVYMRMPNVVYD